MLIPKPSKIRDKKHLAFLRTLPCVRYGSSPSQAAHIRIGTDGATGMKPSDSYCVPLSHIAHSDQHKWGELTFWSGQMGVEWAVELAQQLYKNSGDRAECVRLISRARKMIWG